MIDKKILLLDSEKNILITYQAILSEDYHILVTNTTQEAITILSEQSIDILITEFYLKGINTLDFITEVHKIKPEIYIIVLTSASLSTQLYEKIIESGVQDCFIKPLSINNLLVTIKKGLKIGAILKEKNHLANKVNSIEKFLLNKKPQLCNKSFFLKETRQELDRANRYLTSFSIILLEYNFLNKYGNHNLNNLIDDTLLSKLRHTDLISRFNGTYGLLLPETTKGGIQHLCKRLQERIATLTLQNGVSSKELAQKMTFISATYPEEEEKIINIINNVENNQ